MKALSCFVILSVLLVSFNCSRESNPAKSTEVFAKYLHDEFHLSIPEEKHHYLLIPRLVCRGCVVAGIKAIADSAEQEDYRRMTFITSNKEAMLEPVSL